MNITVLLEKNCKNWSKWNLKILSDSVSQFASKFIKNLIRALDMKIILLIAYHPQTNGQIEWINQKVEVFLWYYINYQ